jgi:hypothetical protein
MRPVNVTRMRFDSDICFRHLMGQYVQHAAPRPRACGVAADTEMF